MDIIQRPSPNFDERNGEDVTFLILHYTGMKTAEDALTRLCDKASEVSAHYTIDEDGVIYQHVEEGKRAWHAGVSSWQGQDKINARSVGIELVNKGHEWGYHKLKNFAQEGIGVWPDVSDEDVLKGGLIQDVSQGLRRVGYEASKSQNMLIAFQRHYVPEVFEAGTEGVACSLTKARLYALQAGHIIN